MFFDDFDFLWRRFLFLLSYLRNILNFFSLWIVFLWVYYFPNLFNLVLFVFRSLYRGGRWRASFAFLISFYILSLLFRFVLDINLISRLRSKFVKDTVISDSRTNFLQILNMLFDIIVRQESFVWMLLLYFLLSVRLLAVFGVKSEQFKNFIVWKVFSNNLLFLHCGLVHS